MHRTARRLEREARYSEGRMRGLLHRALPASPTVAPDDVTLAQKVRSEVLGQGRFRALDVHVDTAAGVVALRGEVPSTAGMAELMAAVGTVRGVARVDSYLHLPGELAPNKRDVYLAT
jgi:osmotically-inducible protein OsmY